MLKRKSNIGGFCAIYKVDNKTIIGAAADGVGTKLDLAIKHNMLDTIGIGLVAMNVNDLLLEVLYRLFWIILQ